MKKIVLKKVLGIGLVIFFGIALLYRVILDNFNTDKMVFAFVFLLVSCLMLSYLIIGLIIDINKTNISVHNPIR